MFRRQTVTAGAFKDLRRFVSNSQDPIVAKVALTVDTDFAGLFERRADDRHSPQSRHSAPGPPSGRGRGVRLRAGRLALAHHGDRRARPDNVHASDGPSHELVWRLPFTPHAEAEMRLHVAAHPHGGPQLAAQPVRDTTLQLPDLGNDLGLACAQGLTDLDLLTIQATGVDGEPVSIPGAGVPWYLTLFGRDSLLKVPRRRRRSRRPTRRARGSPAPRTARTSAPTGAAAGTARAR